MAMAVRRPDFNWENMLRWWNAHSDGSHSPVSEEEDQNIEESMKYQPLLSIYDCVDRVQRFAETFHHNTEDVKCNEDMEEELFSSISARFHADLDYIQGLVEYIDLAKELHASDSLAPLFHKVLCTKHSAGLYNKHASVRAKAAEVITTMVQNNPSSQQLVMEVNGLQPLLYNFTSDSDVTARTEALGAISALIRNNEPGITAFLQDNGYAALRDALNSEESVRLQREALNLIPYLLHENSSDCNIVIQLGFPRIMMHLTSSDDAHVREAALRGLLVLARDEGVRNDDKLKQVLQEWIEGISAMAPEDLVVAREEILLLESLWKACYSVPSSLEEKGLLVLPGCELPEHQELA